jgi:hypothetical protein
MMSLANPAFLDMIENWLRTRPEILVMIRHSRAGGRKEFEFFSSYDSLIARLGRLPPRTSVVAFREPQLPLRGVVEGEFITNCLNTLPDNSEFLLLEIPRPECAEVTGPDWTAGETHAELREALEGARGHRVAVGPYPPWLDETSAVIAGVVPDSDGVVRSGVY